MPSSDQSDLLATPCSRFIDTCEGRDRAIPRCGRCVRAGYDCRLAFKFKSSKGSFVKHQKWLTQPALAVKYVDETEVVAAGGSIEDSSEPCLPEPDESNHQSWMSEVAHPNGSGEAINTTQEPSLPAFKPPHSSIADLLNDQVEPATAAGGRRSSRETSAHFSELQQEIQLRSNHVHSPFEARSHHDPRDTWGQGGGGMPSPMYQMVSDLPLKNRTEATLFRHYLQKLATCLDLCDPMRHFELVVPHRASHCNMLLNSIFAIAARHLSHTTDFDPLISNMYLDECLKYLTPMLSDTSSLSDENLFAATVILRMLEEMDGSHTGHDNHGHLLGIQAFVNVGDQYMNPGSLSAASFWVGLRQEIYIAVITQQPVKMNLDHHIVDRTFEPTDDYTWSNRAVVHLADVLNLCFGENSQSTRRERWQTLDEASRKWTETRPVSFNPFFYKDRTAESVFPEIWHGSSCHVIGIQHHMLAQLFLTQFDPSIPQVGLNRRAAMVRAHNRIETLVRELCGIGLCNQWSPPAMFTACMGIAMFGDEFSEPADQDALIGLLRKTEDDHARPTAAIRLQLKHAWGWTGTEQ
ncbi:hypothetical protein Micbo1qcDRAFT_171474 [Microdochium bolleyi]|uniref:Zn(2)-C6 fungal-type domain-containing protein n=1 Tax=Microdochium bolleyi TaxID=196109 RepID=A0A136JD15_9PEZI|nr:hypothetical protein Micbo1qcDRAFT_171474 [Microdochium bolleyi]